MNHGMRSPGDAGVHAEILAPPAPEPGSPVRLTIRLRDQATGAPLTDLPVSHEWAIHLIAVRQDLEHFQHLHPEPVDRPGDYGVDVMFPEAGRYLLYTEFGHTGETLLQRDVVTVGSAAARPGPAGEDLTPKQFDAVRVLLSGAGEIRAGRDTTLTLRVEDARSSAGLRGLEPYLGAPAHVIVLGMDGGHFGHTHGEAPAAGPQGHGGHGAHAGHGGASTSLGPEVRFHYRFPAPGLYKVWAQMRTPHHGVISPGFVVRAR